MLRDFHMLVLHRSRREEEQGRCYRLTLLYTSFPIWNAHVFCSIAFYPALGLVLITD